MFELTVPNLGDEDGSNPIVMEWLKKTGDTIVQDEVAVTLGAEEWFMEVPSPVSGYIKKIISQEGTAVKSGSILALIAEDQSVLHKQDNPDKPTKEKVGESVNTANDKDTDEAWSKSLLGHLTESIKEIPQGIINDIRRLVALITHGVKDEWGEDKPPIWVKIAWGGANFITWTIRLVVGIALIYLVTNHVLAPYFTKKVPFMESC